MKGEGGGLTLLYGTAVTLRPVTHEDVCRLVQILAEPEVAQWWSRYNEERVRHELVESSYVTAFAIEVRGELIGCAQYHEEPARDYRFASLDIFIDPAWHGKGLGTDAVRTLARHLVHDKGHHRLSIDPAADNLKAIRAFQSVGFKPVGVMRQYQRDTDGDWKDALLMDLLKKDLQ
jgi:aminoglycoside 6'-N-acetyltransferase